jgi:FMN phosphatase YigB (HAD superfamily)
VKSSCGFEPLAVKTVSELKKRGFRVALATNPLFPREATERRIRWTGLSPNDFEIYTTYENSSFCKPDLAYYTEVIEKLGVKADECLMVGNDVGEDMIAEKLGMKVFLVTNCLINNSNVDISAFPHGDLSALLNFVDQLLRVN